jgi:hypothetical protein
LDGIENDSPHGVDDYADGLGQCSDPVCHSPLGDSEANNVRSARDGGDNDDGLIGFPAEPGCDSAQDE